MKINEIATKTQIDEGILDTALLKGRNAVNAVRRGANAFSNSGAGQALDKTANFAKGVGQAYNVAPIVSDYAKDAGHSLGVALGLTTPTQQEELDKYIADITSRLKPAASKKFSSNLITFLQSSPQLQQEWPQLKAGMKALYNTQNASDKMDRPWAQEPKFDDVVANLDLLEAANPGLGRRMVAFKQQLSGLIVTATKKILEQLVPEFSKYEQYFEKTKSFPQVRTTADLEKTIQDKANRIIDTFIKTGKIDSRIVDALFETAIWPFYVAQAAFKFSKNKQRFQPLDSQDSPETQETEEQKKAREDASYKAASEAYKASGKMAGTHDRSTQYNEAFKAMSSLAKFIKGHFPQQAEGFLNAVKSA